MKGQEIKTDSRSLRGEKMFKSEISWPRGQIPCKRLVYKCQTLTSVWEDQYSSVVSQTHLSFELSMTLLVFLRFYELETKKISIFKRTCN